MKLLFDQNLSYRLVRALADILSAKSDAWFPPKVIWVRLGNCTTANIERLLRRYERIIKEFELSDVATFLVLP